MADKQDRTQPPGEAEMGTLLRWARVAFAVRCAQRVQPLYRHYWPSAPEKHVRALDQAITVAADSARLGRPASTLAIDVGTRAAAATHATTRTAAARVRAPAARNTSAADAAADAAAVDAAACSAYTAVRAAYTAVSAADASVYAAAAAAAAARAAAAATPRAAHAAAIKAMWNDYELLVSTGEGGRTVLSRLRVSDHSVDPDSLGPLWPEGTPKGWPVVMNQTTGEPYQPMLHVEFSVPAGVDRKRVDEHIRRILVDLSDLYRAHGGSGLKVADGHAYESDPAPAHEPAPDQIDSADGSSEGRSRRSVGRAGVCS